MNLQYINYVPKARGWSQHNDMETPIIGKAKRLRVRPENSSILFIGVHEITRFRKLQNQTGLPEKMR